MLRFLTVLVSVLVLGTHDAAASGTVELSNVSDFTLGTWSIGDPAVTSSMSLCVYASTSPAGSYGVTIGSVGGFQLSSGSNHIPYALYWNDGGPGNLSSGAGVQVTNAADLSSQANASVNLPPLCISGGPTALLTIKIAQTDMAAALAGTYSGTITITISPT